jgi:hypothetical protein
MHARECIPYTKVNINIDFKGKSIENACVSFVMELRNFEKW